MIHHWMKQSEHIPADAMSRLQQVFPREHSALEAEAHAAERGRRSAHSPEEGELTQEAHELVTLKEELAVAQAALADAAARTETLSKDAVSANEREEILLKSVEQTAKELKEKIEQKTNLTAADESGRVQIITLVDRMKTVCQALANEDLKLSEERDNIATGLVKDLTDAQQMVDRAGRLTNIIKKVAKHLNKNIGTTAINSIASEITQYRALLNSIKKDAKKVDPKDAGAIASINKQLAECQESLNQLQSLLAQARSTKKQLDKMVDDTRKEFDETSKTLNELKNTIPKNLTTELINNRAEQDRHSEALKKSKEELVQKLTALASTNLRAEMLAVQASSALSEFFVHYLALRENAGKLTHTIKKCLDAAILALQQEIVTFSHIDTITKQIDQISNTSLTLTESASKLLQKPIDETNAKKAREEFEQLNAIEEQERRNIAQQTLNSVQQASKDIEAFISQDTRSVDAAKTHRTNLLSELSAAQEHIIHNKEEILQNAKKQLVGAQQQMDDTIAHAQQRRGAA